MNSAQVWAIVGVFAAIVPVMYAMMRDLRTSIVRELRSELGAEIRTVRSDLGADIREFRSETTRRFDAVDARFESEREYQDIRFSAVEHRLDAIESDMTIIKSALIGRISA